MLVCVLRMTMMVTLVVGVKRLGSKEDGHYKEVPTMSVYMDGFNI